MLNGQADENENKSIAYKRCEIIVALCHFVWRVGLVGKALDCDLEVPGSSPGDATFSARNFLGQGIHSHCSGQLSLSSVSGR